MSHLPESRSAAETLLIRSVPQSERPRERYQRAGMESLSLRECLALIMGSGPKKWGCMGLAEQVLARYCGITFDPANPSAERCEEVFFHCFDTKNPIQPGDLYGFGLARQAQLLAVMEIARRYHHYQLTYYGQNEQCQDPRPNGILKVVSPQLRSNRREWIGWIPVWRNHRNSSLRILQKGGPTFVQFEISDLFAELLSIRPDGFYLIHNHPSGSLLPSQQDLHLTEKLKCLAEEFSIPLLGHWIVTTTGERLIT